MTRGIRDAPVSILREKAGPADWDEHRGLGMSGLLIAEDEDALLEVFAEVVEALGLSRRSVS